MKYFLVTFFVMVAVIAGMAIGVIIANKRLSGSCGGLGRVMGDDCDYCDKKDECEAEKKADPSVC